MGIFGNTFGGWHLLLILAVVILLFGAAKLPALAKSVGQSMKIFKSEVKSGSAETPTPEAAPFQQTPPSAAPQASATETHPKP